MQGLTFRGLAAELGGGVGSICWYLSGREELIRLPIGSRVGAGACATAGAFTGIGFGSDRTISATGACGRAGGAASLLAAAVNGGAIAKIGAGCGPGCR